MIYGNTVGGSGGNGVGKTFIIQDDDGYELVGVVTDKQVIFDATPNDIRIGKVAATQNGVTTGEKEIPAYHTDEGYRVIPNGSEFIVATKNPDYTKMQAIICPFNSSIAKSVAAEKVAIDSNVYAVQTTDVVATVASDTDSKRIIFGITNESGIPYLVRYFSYKEIY